jgi:hypothetical protein
MLPDNDKKGWEKRDRLELQTLNSVPGCKRGKMEPKEPNFFNAQLTGRILLLYLQK